MTDCYEESLQSHHLTMSTSNMFVFVDDDDDDLDAVTRSMSFRRCPVIRPVRGLRRSFVRQSSNSVHSSISRAHTSPNDLTNGR